MIISTCIAKNITAAIAFENIIISGLLGLTTGIMVKYHLLEEHLHIKHIKPMPHQEISINKNNKKD